ncbi:hypothetical protein EV192_10719 [Actinocrispum wychmicini]|uniref:Uncharacterized protein n=1 Tax=Actinocrispum wychmicini TaxID=1213861 RepID=A0A4R2JFG6_9PSEU|nr:hypothetical protein EV192_10719 [Actinocrispum wychmicini]
MWHCEPAPSVGRVSVSTTANTFRPVEITEHWNNRSMSTVDDKGDGRFNVWRNSFPAEHLPRPGERVTVGGVPFDFPPATSAGDNARCAGQFVTLPPGHFDWIRLLASAERRVEDTVALHFADGQVDFEAIRVSDFWAAPACFGETLAYRTPVMHYPHHVQPRVEAMLWSQRVPVTRDATLTGLRLPNNRALHIFALTLQEST